MPRIGETPKLFENASRRSVMGVIVGAAGAAVAGTAAVVAGTSRVAQQLAVFMVARSEQLRYRDAWNAAYDRFKATVPMPPDEVLFPCVSLYPAFQHWDQGTEICEIPTGKTARSKRYLTSAALREFVDRPGYGWADLTAKARRLAEVSEAFEHAVEAACIAAGFSSSDTAWTEAIARETEALDALMDEPAQTAADFLLKAGALAALASANECIESASEDLVSQMMQFQGGVHV
jgi:hypothetical protein